MKNAPVKEVTLLFPTLPMVWEFKSLVSLKDYQVVSSSHALFGAFTEKEIDLALTQFRAVIVQK